MISHTNTVTVGMARELSDPRSIRIGEFELAVTTKGGRVSFEVGKGSSKISLGVSTLPYKGTFDGARFVITSTYYKLWAPHTVRVDSVNHSVQFHSTPSEFVPNI